MGFEYLYSRLELGYIVLLLFFFFGDKIVFNYSF